MTIHLPKDLKTALRLLVQDGVFATMDDALAEAARRLIAERGVERNQANGAEPAKGNGRPSPDTVFEVMERAGLIGCLGGRSGTPTDLAANPIHMEGFGGD